MKELTITQKLNMLDCYIFNCYCSPSFFWENVGTDKPIVMRQIKEAQTEKDICKIVNQYI